MKTGMVTLTMNNAKARLYPTFKEWKLTIKSKASSLVISLYPTFKEWKQWHWMAKYAPLIVYILPLRNENTVSVLSFVTVIIGLYPTFKEWKPVIMVLVLKRFSSVYILPLRNENPSWAYIFTSDTPVYILPLRNENNKCELKKSIT